MRFFTLLPFLAVELAVFMVGVPLILWLLLPPSAILAGLWVMALVCFLIARATTSKPDRNWFNWQAVNWVNLRPVLLRFAFCGVLMLVATYLYKPHLLFNFVLERPKLWAMVMVLYPIISVLPQEMIYRTYTFTRFSRLIPHAWVMIVISGLGFGFGHIVFDNWVAPVLCSVGGLIFAHTYYKTRSLALVAIEHALYGDLVFTIGLGRYFYHGAVGAAP